MYITEKLQIRIKYMMLDTTTKVHCVFLEGQN